MATNFGRFIKELRAERRIGLREFCLQYGHDPSNWSKVERGVLSPPKNEETLAEWAKQLGLKKGEERWYQFFDLAFLAQGKIPNDILSDEELVGKLPVFFRTLRGQKPTKQELENVVKLLRKG